VARLDEATCRSRLAQARHGVLATVHDQRGTDAVPVVFAAFGTGFVVPVDTVKPKTSTRLGRAVNLEADARFCLLVDSWSEDWAELWWVRAHGTARAADPSELANAADALARRYPPYRTAGSIVAAILLDVQRWQGWAAR
jgi:PPOX class probable F420-dependent enzyme